MAEGYQKTEETDNTILYVFLPIVAVLLLLCAGGCYYAERKRKRRIFKEALENSNNAFSDTDSVISASSIRNRPYLLPSAGRTFRSPSRSDYDVDSTYGEPPPYSGGSRRTSISSVKASQEALRLKNEGSFNGSRSSSSTRPLSRSTSLVDLRSDFDSPPLRRSRSILSLQHENRNNNNFPNRPSLNEDRNSRNLNCPSPSQSEWSIRTAPQMRNYSFDYDENRPSSVASLPVRNRRGTLKRSMSQPNLKNSVSRTGTYPQGILKRNRITGQTLQQDRSVYPIESEIYNNKNSVNREQNFHQIENSGFPPSKDYNMNRRYQRYPRDSNEGYQAHYPNLQEDIYSGSIYSSPGSSQVGYIGSNRPWGPQYSRNYDPYSYSGNYWEQQNGVHQINPYSYGSMMY